MKFGRVPTTDTILRRCRQSAASVPRRICADMRDRDVVRATRCLLLERPRPSVTDGRVRREVRALSRGRP